MHRFFLSPDNIHAGKVFFPAEISHQAARVLRLKAAEQVIVLDNLGMEFLVSITQVDDRQTIGEVIDQHQANNEPQVRIHLCPSLSQREKFEMILQKCTEVGVAAFTPLFTSRSLVQKTTEPTFKVDRWRKIIQEAAEQSGRGKIPEINPPLSFAQGIIRARQHTRASFILWEGEQNLLLSQAVKKLDLLNKEVEIGLFIGPEGGYTEEEVTLARNSALLPVSIGKRILRTETAAIVGSALLLQCLGEMA